MNEVQPQKKYRVSNIIGNVFALVILGAGVYFFHTQIGDATSLLLARYVPCRVPLTYSVDSFDTRFGISKTTFLKDIAAAEKLWETAAGKSLFRSVPNGHLKINLMYDNRQDTTVSLQKIGTAVDATRGEYDALKAQYEHVRATYQVDKVSYDAREVQFSADLSAYNSEVANWNAHGGAPKGTVQVLAQKKQTLAVEQSNLDAARRNLNTEVSQVNTLATQLNELAHALNINVAQYNAVGGQYGGEFDEGDYQSGPAGQTISIYQFTDEAKLIRVLAHELGHALGLEHVDDQNAIMYYLNQGTAKALTATDISALKTHCGLK